ncbi:MAG: hypothetical protein ACXADB_15085 [Candidatus Hermodarchaeia archaeon]|jgi:hypothetical protein
MNRRDIFKSFLGLSVAGCAGNEIFRLEDKPKMDYKRPDVVVDTDDRYYDEWLDEYGKDEMHLEQRQ